MKKSVSLILACLLLLALIPVSGYALADGEQDTPAETAAGSISFAESENFPLPTVDGPIPKGHPFWIDGTVRSKAPLVSVCAVIRNSKGNVAETAEQTFRQSENVTEYQLLDITFSKDVRCLSEKIRFSALPAGTFTLVLTAKDANGYEATLASAKFTVTSDTWITLLPNNLRGNYTDALRFFGSPERFLFRYKFGSGRSITVASSWRSKYCSYVTGVNGKRWNCHIDAVPYFTLATHYIENTYVRIHGTNGDTGAVRLSDLLTFNGSLVQRYVSSLDFISHHSFGTAIDVNASTPSHKNKLENREKIYHEVADNLTYNGLRKSGGKICYDFSYSGSADNGPEGVPEPLLNYLLYELGFYRAGFSWGLYYPHTCDGMHFTLSELSPSYFTDGPYAMRKVFSYLDDTPAKADFADDVPRYGDMPYAVYNGNAQTPAVILLDANGRPIHASKYTVRYENNVGPGTACARITLNETGETRTLWFKIYLPPTASTEVANENEGIRLRWTKVTGAKGYVIYRRAWNLVDAGWTAFARWNNTTGTEWTDTKVYPGTRYQYGVKAYFTDPMDLYNLGLVGPLKTTVRITTRTLNAVEAGSGQLTAKWSGSSFFTGYELQIARDEAFTSGVKNVTIGSADTYRTTVKNLRSGRTYYVRVRSFHIFEGMTYYGAWSNVLSCKVK